MVELKKEKRMIEIKQDNYGRNIVVVPTVNSDVNPFLSIEMNIKTSYERLPFDDDWQTVLRGRLIDYITELQEKVQNALQLPFKIGQIAYTITENDGVWKLDKGKIVGVEEIDSYNGKELCAIISKKAPNGEALKFYWSVKYYGEEWTTDKDVITKEFLRITGEQQ